MFELLLIVSLLIHGFVFFWIIVLIQRIRQTESRIEEMNQVKMEIEDVLLAYTTEMKEENERLLQRLRERNDQKVTKSQQQEWKVESSEPPPSINHPEKEEYVPPLELSSQETYVKSYHAQVLELFELGLSAEEIAKKLEMGKGEVELILKFSR